MADIKISGLPAASSVADADELELNQAGTSRKATRAQMVAGLGGSGDAAPTNVETTATPHVLAIGQGAHLSITLHPHAASVDFDIAETSPAGRWIIEATDKDTVEALASCTISLAGAGLLNGGTAGRQIAPGGTAVVTVINPSGTSPIVRIAGDIYEPPNTRGATNPVPKSDLFQTWLITGDQIFDTAATYPDGFQALYIASGLARWLVGTASHAIPMDGCAVVYRAGGRLVAVGPKNNAGEGEPHVTLLRS